MTQRIEWEASSWGGTSWDGRVGGIRLFTVSYGTTRQDAMYVLRTDLLVGSSMLGQKYHTPEDAKAAAERLLVSFVKKIGATFPEEG